MDDGVAREDRHREPGGVWRTYVLASLPGWLLGLLAAWALFAWFAVPWWAALLLLALWVARDLVTYPRMRRYYESQPPETRMLGKLGVAATDLAPSGFARVHGELWAAKLVRPQLRMMKGATLRVRGIHGLALVVEPSPESGPGDLAQGSPSID